MGKASYDDNASLHSNTESLVWTAAAETNCISLSRLEFTWSSYAVIAGKGPQRMFVSGQLVHTVLTGDEKLIMFCQTAVALLVFTQNLT